MKPTRHTLLLLALSYGIVYSTPSLKQYAKKMKSFFCRQTAEKIDYKEFSAASLHSLSIENSNGPITIKTGWKKKSLCLKTIKHARNTVELNDIKIAADAKTPHHLSLITKQKNPSQGTIEYELIVPANLNLSLTAHNGSIHVNDIEGTITAITDNGDITITNTKNTVHAQAHSVGSITIENAQGAINCLTQCGTIVINNAHNNLSAFTQKGKIITQYNTLDNATTIALETSSGDIILTLPTQSNATIHGTTAHGAIFSDHYITLKPYTTQLNTLAWKKLKKEINGTIGSGAVDISLCSLWGTIKILEQKI